MARSRGFRLIFSRGMIVAILGGLVATAFRVDARPEPVQSTTDFAEITKGDLISRVPSFYVFDYPFPPLPGKRLWLRVDDRHFVERYPDGSESRFLILGHTEVRGMPGTILVKMAGDLDKTGADNDGNFQVFISDKGSPEMRTLFRRSGPDGSDWRDNLGGDRKTTLRKVE